MDRSEEPGNAITVAVNSGVIQRDGDFLLWPGAPVPLRDRSVVTSPGLRRIEMLPPMEIDEGLKTILHQSFGATGEEAVNAVSRALGFTSTSGQLRDLILSRISQLREDQVLVEGNGVERSGGLAPVCRPRRHQLDALARMSPSRRGCPMENAPAVSRPRRRSRPTMSCEETFNC